MDETIYLNDDYGDIHTPIHVDVDLDDEDMTIPISNQCRTTNKKHAYSTSSSRRPKTKKASMASSMDEMLYSIDKLNETLLQPQVIELDEEHKLKDLQDIYGALNLVLVL